MKREEEIERVRKDGKVRTERLRSHLYIIFPSFLLIIMIIIIIIVRHFPDCLCNII